MNKSVISIYTASKSIVISAVLLLLISCGSDKSEETYFQFGDELYTKSQVNSFLDEIYGDERIGRIFIWHPDYVEVPYKLFLSPEFDSPKFRSLFNDTLALYKDLLPVKFKETEDGEPYNAMFAFVKSYDQVMSLQMAHFMLDKDQITEQEYKDFWLSESSYTNTILKKYGHEDASKKERLTTVYELNVTKPTLGNTQITGRQISTGLCKAFISAEGIPTSTIKSCASSGVGSEFFPIDIALLKALKHLSERITNLGETQAKKEILNYFEQEYGTTRPQSKANLH